MMMPDRTMINQPHPGQSLQAPSDFALGAPITVVVTVGPLEVF
jgi:hypothetical protein